MIGYYIHHQGRGHLRHAHALCSRLDVPVTGLSSLPRPPQWDGEWLQLPRDDEGPQPRDVDARGRLHWVPAGDAGLRDRMACIADWISSNNPDLMVSDVSVEVTLLARLHGVPVISVVLPGRRADPAHRLGYGVSCQLVAPWPRAARRTATGLTRTDRRRLSYLGGISPPGARPDPGGRQEGSRLVTVLSGAGGNQPTAEAWERASGQTPGWTWTTLGGTGNVWVEDPLPVLVSADVVVTHAGLGALADVANARRPAVVIPAARPYGEQQATSRALRSSRWPAIVRQTFPATGWAGLLTATQRLDGRQWKGWVDGKAADRFARVVRDELDHPARGRSR